jgi:hypothetical protein
VLIDWIKFIRKSKTTSKRQNVKQATINKNKKYLGATWPNLSSQECDCVLADPLEHVHLHDGLAVKAVGVGLLDIGSCKNGKCLKLNGVGPVDNRPSPD